MGKLQNQSLFIELISNIREKWLTYSSGSNQIVLLLTCSLIYLVLIILVSQ